MHLKSTLSLPATIAALQLVQGFGRELAVLADFDTNRINAIMLACEEAFVAIVERAAADPIEPVLICGELTPLELTLSFSDREMPPSPDEDELPHLDAWHLDAAQLNGMGRLLIRAASDEALWQSLGQEGNRLTLIFKRTAASISMEHTPETIPDRHQPSAEEQNYIIRRATLEDDWYRIARTIFYAYGHTYHRDDIYYPERLKELNRAGRLVSVVAVTATGDIAGHYALELGGPGQISSKQYVVAESCMAVVTPGHRGQGLLKQMRKQLESEACRLRLHGLFSQPAANQPLSQQINETFGALPCALSLALLASSPHFQTTTEDQTAQRESCLLYFKPLTPVAPRRIYPPVRHQAMLRETYQACGIPVTVAQISGTAAGTSQVSAHYLAALDLGTIRVEVVGADIAAALQAARNDLCRKTGARVLNLTVCLTCPGAAETCAAAERLGFFYGGLSPLYDDGEDVLRMQYLDTTLDIARLTVAGPFANRLLDYVEADRRRVAHTLAPGWQ